MSNSSETELIICSIFHSADLFLDDDLVGLIGVLSILLTMFLTMFELQSDMMKFRREQYDSSKESSDCSNHRLIQH